MNARANLDQTQRPVNAAAHDPFSFLHPRLKHNHMAQFAESVLDITQGIAVCLEMVHSSSLARDMNEHSEPDEQQQPLVDIVDTDRLLRFTSTAAALMADRAEKQIEWMNEYLDKESSK
jgi:hypothetical protein